jgi:hypothetical protein
MTRDARPLRLLVYDRTWQHKRWLRQVGLTSSWIGGGALYRAMNRLDHVCGVTSWREAVDWLTAVEPGARIGEIQFWGHGKWGQAYVGAEDILDVGALQSGHALYDGLARVRDRLTRDADSSPRVRWWFRTCETFGTDVGHDFAQRWTRFFDAPAAGHTYVIGPWQSGLHSLAPGATPTWSVSEGLPDPPLDKKGEKKHALMSTRRAPNTITCLHGAVPAGF